LGQRVWGEGEGVKNLWADRTTLRAVARGGLGPRVVDVARGGDLWRERGKEEKFFGNARSQRKVGSKKK